MAIIVGCDFHSGYQRIAFLDTERGEIEERSLTQSGAEVEQFYSIGGWAGPRQIWRQQKTDRRDAGHTLKLLIESCFPRICTPTVEKRDHRQLLIHRYRLVQLRTRVKNELQHLALNQGLQWKRKLWTTEGRAMLETFPLERWTARRRHDLLQLLAILEGQFESLNQAVIEVAEANPSARLLIPQTGVGPVTALAFVLPIGDARRFSRSKQVSSYLGLIPRQHSLGGKQMLCSISKQGNRLLRTLLVEPAQSVVRFDSEFRRGCQPRCRRKHRAVAKVAAARKLAVRLSWMLRTQTPSPAFSHRE